MGREERERLDANAVDDLVLLRTENITESGIVNNLRNRYNKDLIYTYIGPVLLSVNPFKNIRGLYSEDLMQAYRHKFKYEVAPHVFASADEAYHKLLSTGINQCVLISGESGAGKTEAAKKVMEYVSKISRDYAEVSTNNRTVTEIKDSLLKSNPVLEAFGNAKTLRNDNSSRFGKYMEIQMDYNGTPLGGRISNYLLEKPRVVHQTEGERNFHIFYLLCAGMPSQDPLKRQLSLQDANNFHYLADSNSVNVKGIDDREWYVEMDNAMESVGINRTTKADIYTVVAAVLWLGNIDFRNTKVGGQDACTVSTTDALRNAAALLQVSEKQLQEAITTRTRTARSETVKSPLTTVDECKKSRDALAKALYARMFQKLVELINKTIHTDVAELSLGVLDIYGFEIFKHNSFEQLCINYCNEKLQQYFIQLTLKAEQEEYKREGIEWKNIDYFNNQIVCDLIEGKRPAGVIAFLDEEITLGRGTDMTFLSKMNQQLARHPHYKSCETDTNAKPTEFIIKHYAGEVMYSADGMLDKNMDTLFRDLLELTGQQSRSTFIRDMFPEGREKHDYKKPVTAGTQFVKDMNGLIEALAKCEPHYIRTIKPNDNKQSGRYMDDLVAHQVRYLGLLENVRVRRAGFAYRREYTLFVRRYKMLTPQTWPKSSGNDKRDTETILASVGIDRSEYQNGKTKIFIKEPQSLFKLEHAREEKMHHVVSVIQRAYRSWKARLYFQQIREKAVKLLHTRKRRNNSWVLYFLGDYIEAFKNEAVQNIIGEHGDGRVVFADFVEIYTFGKKRTVTREIFVITKSSLLVFDPTFKLIRRIMFQEIRLVALSTFADNFISFNFEPVNGPKGPVEQPSLVMYSVRKSEIATVLAEEYQAKLRTKLNLQFQDSQRIIVMQKKPGLVGRLKKAVPTEHRLEFREDSSMPRKTAQLLPPRQKNDPGFDRNLDEIAVSSDLGSRAELQLNSELPERVIAHTAVGRQGKKRPRNRRVMY